MPESCLAFNRFKTEFQSYHVGPPGIRPLLLKTVDCLAVDRNNEPILLKRRKRQRIQRQATVRYFYEVARIASRWCFVEWSLDGAVVDLQITGTLEEALALYEREPGTVTILDVP